MSQPKQNYYLSPPIQVASITQPLVHPSLCGPSGAKMYFRYWKKKLLSQFPQTFIFQL